MPSLCGTCSRSSEAAWSRFWQKSQSNPDPPLSPLADNVLVFSFHALLEGTHSQGNRSLKSWPNLFCVHNHSQDKLAHAVKLPHLVQTLQSNTADEAVFHLEGIHLGCSTREHSAGDGCGVPSIHTHAKIGQPSCCYLLDSKRPVPFQNHQEHFGVNATTSKCRLLWWVGTMEFAEEGKRFQPSHVDEMDTIYNDFEETL